MPWDFSAGKKSEIKCDCIESRWNDHSPFGKNVSLFLIKIEFTTDLKMYVTPNESLWWTLASSVHFSAPLTTFTHSPAPRSHLTVSTEEGESWRQGQTPFSPSVCPLCPPYSFLVPFVFLSPRFDNTALLPMLSIRYMYRYKHAILHQNIYRHPALFKI